MSSRLRISGRSRIALRRRNERRANHRMSAQKSFNATAHSSRRVAHSCAAASASPCKGRQTRSPVESCKKRCLIEACPRLRTSVIGAAHRLSKDSAPHARVQIHLPQRAAVLPSELRVGMVQPTGSGCVGSRVSGCRAAPIPCQRQRVLGLPAWAGWLGSREIQLQPLSSCVRMPIRACDAGSL